MAFTPGLYNINDVVCDVNGWTIQAPAAEKPYETERTEPKDLKVKVGALGQGTIVYQPDRSGRFIIRIKQNSFDDNKTLHNLRDANAIFPVTLSNRVTKEKATCQFCFIEEAPRIQFNAADENELEWKIGAVELVETRGK